MSRAFMPICPVPRKARIKTFASRKVRVAANGYSSERLPPRRSRTSASTSSHVSKCPPSEINCSRSCLRRRPNAVLGVQWSYCSRNSRSATSCDSGSLPKLPEAPLGGHHHDNRSLCPSQVGPFRYLGSRASGFNSREAANHLLDVSGFAMVNCRLNRRRSQITELLHLEQIWAPCSFDLAKCAFRPSFGRARCLPVFCWLCSSGRS
jgi:hypothetical protein